MAFSNILPDTYTKWGAAGEANATTGAYGPGFAGIKLTSHEWSMFSKLNSLQVNKRAGSYHKWLIDIKYNGLVAAEFNAVFSFLRYKRATMTPFEIFLPQYKDQLTTDKTVSYGKVKGDTYFTVTDDATAPIAPEPGQIFKFDTHDKVYMVTRVETPTEYLTELGAPSDTLGEERIHFTPGLAQDIFVNDTVTFDTVRFLVIQQGNPEYSLDKNALYNITLQVEEVHV